MNNKNKHDKHTKRPYKAHTEPLNGDRRLIYRVKKAGLTTFHPKGQWNGYGYEQLPLVVQINSLADKRKFNKIKREVDLLPAIRKKTEEEKILSWAKRLVKVYNSRVDSDDDKITLEEALEIAHEKLEYKQDEIDRLIERQDERYSVKRERWINKKERENPLRRIVDEGHAMAIMAAHHRHADTNYDDYLQEAHELEKVGLLPKGYARDMINGNYEKYD